MQNVDLEIISEANAEDESPMSESVKNKNPLDENEFIVNDGLSKPQNFTQKTKCN